MDLKKNKKSLNNGSAFAFYFLGLPLCIVAVGAGIAYFFFSGPRTKPQTTATSRREGFASEYPVSRKFQVELTQRIKKGLTTPKTQSLIRKWTHDIAADLQMPEALLGCLFFQESRFNPLSGHDSKAPAKGLGQFLSFSFYEVNNHLDRFTRENYPVFLKYFNRDIRPIDALTTAGPNPSSYYEIPTAVISSASYLNNRYHQLDRTLRAQGYAPSSQLLWLFAVIAYNKGTRAVFSLWNNAYHEGGTEHVQHLVSDLLKFQQAVEDQTKLETALGRIWESDVVPRYATELKLHIQNIQRCALDSSSWHTRSLASGEQNEP